jgi:predicted short-subunit dehydrogenase-like oxidoreductase (DUF2520 family)
MASALKAAGHEIVQVYSRTLCNAELLARRLGAEPVDNIRNIYCAADFYIFSVKDDVLPEIALQMPLTTGIWVHTAGSVSISVFSPHTEKGALYPLQTFGRERDVNFRDVPVFIEGNSAETVALLKDLADTISENVRFLSGYKRCVLHLAAVFACNFANHMYALASEIVDDEEIPFHLLNPLITETAAKVAAMSPQAAQTGPAVRLDEEVMVKHLALLNDPMKREIYSLLSDSIHRVSGNH